MDSKAVEGESASIDRPTTFERTSDRETRVRRAFKAPAALVFETWTEPELLMRWWTPKSSGVTFLSCETDVRAGGGYRFVFSHPSAPEPLAFFGRYLEVTRPARLVWTNEESGADGAVTTVTFTERGGETLVEIHDLYPTRAALDAAIASGATGAHEETFAQLDAVLPALG